MRVSLFTFLMVLLPSLILSKEEESIDKRIINGNYAERGQFPYQVRVVLDTSSGGISNCGGSILSDTWILSAAHCARDAVRAIVYMGMIVEQNLPGVLSTVVYADRILSHPRYNRYDPTNDNDVCLLRLNSPIPFSQYPYIKTISLPSLSMGNVSYLDNYIGTISGWGVMNEAKTHPRTLLWAPAHIMPHAQCVNHAKQHFIIYLVTENMICIDKTVFHTGSCYGDSGGPLAVTTNDGVLRVVGVSSWGPPAEHGGCDSSHPAVYAYLGNSGILSWIISTTGIQPD